MLYWRIGDPQHHLAHSARWVQSSENTKEMTNVVLNMDCIRDGKGAASLANIATAWLELINLEILLQALPLLRIAMSSSAAPVVWRDTIMLHDWPLSPDEPRDCRI